MTLEILESLFMASKRCMPATIWKGPYVAVYFLVLVALAGCERADKVLEAHPNFNIWPGPAPGSENWSVSQQAGFRSITNVTRPTLSMFEPDPELASGNVMVVCPGGGFRGLSIIKEGTMVAEWLAARGITAFVLKYRVRRDPDVPLADESEDFAARLQALEPLGKIAAADGIQAMRYLRKHARELHIDPDRIGMMGFSAGAMTTMSVVMEGQDGDRPNIAASIYGAMTGETPPGNAPPLFLVHARDDAVVPLAESLDMESAWNAAGLPVELHVFEAGGHGFGAVEQGEPSDDWLDHFEGWLVDRQWISTK